jgi:Swiss Army Knife RNA repair-like protein
MSMTDKSIKALFVDIDGVLVTLGSMRAKDIEYKADLKCIRQLNRIIKATDAKIVISSTWRSYGLRKLQEIFIGWGIKPRIYGFTPRLDVMYGIESMIGLSAIRTSFLDQLQDIRAHEIALWMRHCPHPIEAAVVIDDDPIGKPVGKWLVQTDFENGLTAKKADEVIARLNAR